jgi:hypothetical protein
MLDYPDLRYFRFVLIRLGPGGDWIVFLDRPGHGENNPRLNDVRCDWAVSKHKGRGASPELAYMKLLEKTADELAVLYVLYHPWQALTRVE